MNTFEEDAKLAVDFHGHLCSGQMIGVKMAHCALKYLGLDPEIDRKRLMVFVECDRCPADAIMAVTGCRAGKRTFHQLDYGKVAATFIDLKTGRGVRIHRKKRMHPQEGEDMIAFYRDLPEREFFSIREVSVDLKPCDLPGKPVESVYCDNCGEDVVDSRQVTRDSRTLCKACAGESYYQWAE